MIKNYKKLNNEYKEMYTCFILNDLDKNISYLFNQIINEEDKIECIIQNAYLIEYINNPSLKIQLEAVKQDSYAITYIKHPSVKVQLFAIKHNLYAIQNIKNPSIKIQLAAVKQDQYAIKFMKNPCKEVIAYINSRKSPYV
jgi:hypothetical protein